MDRRVFLGTVTGGLLVAPLATEAQQSGKVYRIGVMQLYTVAPHQLDAFRQGLRELGWVEGKSIEFEILSADGKLRADCLVVHRWGHLAPRHAIT